MVIMQTLCALLIILVLCSGDYGGLVERHGDLVLPTPPHRVVFAKTKLGNWRLHDTDDTYIHLIGPFFEPIHGGSGRHLYVIVNDLLTDYEIRDQYDHASHLIAESRGISLETFGKNMIYLQRQEGLRCQIHTLNNLFQEQWIDPKEMIRISQLKSAAGTFLYSTMQRDLAVREETKLKIKKPIEFEISSKGWPRSAVKGALLHKGFSIDTKGPGSFEPDSEYYMDPQDAIFGIAVDYSILGGGHIFAIRKMGGIWWKIDSDGFIPSIKSLKKSTSWKKKGVHVRGGVVPCGGTGHWAECRELIRDKIRGQRIGMNGAKIVRCPTMTELNTMVGRGIMPNVKLWPKYCPDLIRDICFSPTLIRGPKYTDIVEKCPCSSEVDCQRIPGRKYHCNINSHTCEEWDNIVELNGGVCEVGNMVHQCPDYLPDCMGEDNWEGNLGKCSCGIHKGKCENPDILLDPPRCLLTKHECAPCTDGHDGNTNRGRSSCRAGLVCRTDVDSISERECVVQRRGSRMEYNQYIDGLTETEISIVYLFIFIFMFLIIICCFVMIISCMFCYLSGSKKTCKFCYV